MKQKLTAVIIDDEEHCVESLQKQLEWSCPHVEVIGTASNVDSGLLLFDSIQPDIAFLDIEMPDGTGFDLISRLSKKDFAIIFTTAYDAFALQAFKVNAIDYILKPIDGEALQNAVSKVVAIPKNQQNEKITSLLANWNAGQSKNKVAFPVSDGLFFAHLSDIIRCESDGAYCHIYLKNKPKLYLSKTLKQVSEMINSDKFIRVHHSHLVNSDFIQKYIRGNGGQVIMDDGISIPVSRSRKDDFLDFM
ncbi:LytR/AlgR family response regulator transcription factor [Portibacter lacus]|uniref:DNA-binding response regulator n=1 Tax=Portibacter lacus TaxID=1099794 RepID=A0AA37WET0_9BACT|nr:LytTR family DNA-binding domain-containing protein [Portibacter lacus]GLR18178.1 DNA-binding response regulator [Portibacter lacus]